MKAKIQETRRYLLEMDEEEAEWLKAVLQNPLHGEHPDRETVEDRTMRARFWGTLNQMTQ